MLKDFIDHSLAYLIVIFLSELTNLLVVSPRSV